MASFYPQFIRDRNRAFIGDVGSPPVKVEEWDAGMNCLVRWHCDPPAPGAYYAPERYEFRGPADGGDTLDVYEWRPAWRRPG